MGVVRRWDGWGRKEMRRKVFGEIVGMVKGFCVIFIWLFLENIDRRSCHDGSPELNQYFTNLNENTDSLPPLVARTLKYLMWVPSLAESSEREEKQVRLNIQ